VNAEHDPITLLASDFAVRERPRPSVEIRHIAAAELRRERIGVRREANQLTVDPEAVTAFVDAYERIKASIAQPAISPLRNYSLQFADEAEEYEHESNAALVRNRALQSFGQKRSALGF
jgi:hypothetical protein